MRNGFINVMFAGLALFIGLNSVLAQNARVKRGGQITGIILDAKDQTPIEYAYIILYSQIDSVQAAGTISVDGGRFLIDNVRPGRYYLEIKYMGFNTFITHDLQIGRRNRRIDLGEIQLEESLQITDKIEVTAEKPAITYLIDKKIINVSQHQTAASGTAAEVLENVPSITVDIEGNVSLRGSSSFLVLIDNKPTILEPSDVLQQIPSSAIEDIEIITNPSAKFDPDGTAGIINIITKKNRLNGISGIVNVNLGLDDKYGTDFLFNFRMPKFNFYIGGDYNIRNYPGTMTEERWIRFNDTTMFINSDGSSMRKRNTYGIKGGLDYSITMHDNISLEMRYGDRNMEGDSRLQYKQWTEPGTLQQLYFSNSDSKRSGGFYALNLDYLHRFSKKGHELSASANYRYRDSDEESVDELLDENGIISSGRKTLEQGPSSPLRFKIDYMFPLNKTDKFEVGYQSRLGHSEDITKLFNYEPVSNDYVNQLQFNSKTEYERDIHGLYGMYSGEAGALGYQGGLRAEFTYRKFRVVNDNQNFKLRRWDFFPTLHLSYHVSDRQQMMLSGTRRIRRPRGYYFEPFDTWTDAYNVRRGNPDLKPQYIDSYELGYQLAMGRSLFSLETYHRFTHNNIERVRSVYDAGITLHTFANAGTASTFGSELMWNTDFFKIWNVNLMANLYRYQVEGHLLGRSFSRESFNWSIRCNNTMRIKKVWRLQANLLYNSPTVSAQGSREGYMMLNLGLRREFLNKTLSLTLQARDILQTAKREFISEGEGFYAKGTFKRQAPVVNLQISWKIHNYKEKHKRGERDPENRDEEDF